MMKEAMKMLGQMVLAIAAGRVRVCFSLYLK